MKDQHCLECMETNQDKIKILHRRAAVETIYQCKCGFKWMDRTIEEDNKK